ncbi:MAG TPA: Fe-S cluster assembly protein SufD, partial [Tenacibaculum sp.]|nr:Fe-S cluster assembly protein SufD [Tenacibaculum sp.]
MELKEKLLSSYVAFENGRDINSDVHEIRTKALQDFEALGFPSKKLEAWKYTSLNSILKEDYSLFPEHEIAIELADVKKYFIHDIDSYKIVFIDGKYSSFLSETTHDVIDVCLMSAALSKPKYKTIIDNYFNKIAK